MLAVSAGFLQAIKNKAPQDVHLEFTGGDVIGTSDIAITSGGLTYTEILNGEMDVIFGRAVMSELSAVLINADGRFTNFDFSREFEAKVGVKVSGTFEYVSLGVFKGNRPDKVRGKLIDFTAHDRMSLFDKSAESFADGLTFPCTLGEIFAKLCAFCGVGYVSAVFPNSGKTFDENPLADTDYTCREILGYIAEAAGAYARMSRSGAVELVWFADVNYTVTRTDRFEMTESEFLTPPIDRLEVYNSYGDQLNSSGSGDIVYGISDNPFLYIENDTQLTGLQPYVDAIYNRISSLPTYHPSSFRAEFNPAVQCGDIISVVDDYGETIRFPVFVQTITWNGFGKTTYENTGGVIRQNAPFTQRELEQIKKKSVKATDLKTYIESYLNTEEGVASITYAVSGKFMAAPPTYEYITPSGVTYGFTKTADGYYTSTNAGISSSFAYGQFTFTNNSEKAQEITLRCISSGENNCDYGIVSTINNDLPKNNNGATATSATVLKTFYGVVTASGATADVKVTLPAGISTITFKFRKDGGVDRGDDCFKILPLVGDFVTNAEATSLIEQRVDAFGASLKLSVSNDQKSSTISLTGDGINLSGTVQFFGEVVFKSDLSTAGSTTINGANIMTGTLSADMINTTDLRVQKVWYYDANAEEKYFSVMSSEISGESTVTRVGPKDIRNGYLQALELYGSAIYFVRAGKTASHSSSLLFDMEAKEIIPASNDDWHIGTSNNSFNRIYLDTGVYLRDQDTSEWSRLYADGDSLYWKNGSGDKHRIV